MASLDNKIKKLIKRYYNPRVGDSDPDEKDRFIKFSNYSVHGGYQECDREMFEDINRQIEELKGGKLRHEMIFKKLKFNLDLQSSTIEVAM